MLSLSVLEGDGMRSGENCTMLEGTPMVGKLSHAKKKLKESASALVMTTKI